MGLVENVEGGPTATGARLAAWDPPVLGAAVAHGLASAGGHPSLWRRASALVVWWALPTRATRACGCLRRHRRLEVAGSSPRRIGARVCDRVVARGRTMEEGDAQGTWGDSQARLFAGRDWRGSRDSWGSNGGGTGALAVPSRLLGRDRRGVRLAACGSKCRRQPAALPAHASTLREPQWAHWHRSCVAGGQSRAQCPRRGWHIGARGGA